MDSTQRDKEHADALTSNNKHDKAEKAFESFRIHIADMSKPHRCKGDRLPAFMYFDTGEANITVEQYHQVMKPFTSYIKPPLVHHTEQIVTFNN